jgi:cold shock CspA family protein
MQNGTVIKKNEKGFGFIKVDGSPDGAKDLFFHSNELQNVTFDALQEGDKVSFEIQEADPVKNPKGANAKMVSKI